MEGERSEETRGARGWWKKEREGGLKETTAGMEERVEEGRKGFKGIAERDTTTARWDEKGEKSENRAKDRNRL